MNFYLMHICNFRAQCAMALQLRSTDNKITEAISRFFV